MQAVKVDAARTNRSLTGGQPDGAATLRQRRVVLADRSLLFFRRELSFNIAAAKRTRDGLPTGDAILARRWISDDRPSREDRSQLGTMHWAGSFECCCEMLGLKVDAERKRVLAEIDEALTQDLLEHAGAVLYQRRAAVLRCAGVPTAIGRQFVLGLVDPADYEDVADPDEARALAVAIKREMRETARTVKRLKRKKKAAVS